MQDLVITPNRGTQSNPTINFTGLNAGSISLNVLPAGNLNFAGNAGTLLNITDSSTFSVSTSGAIVTPGGSSNQWNQAYTYFTYLTSSSGSGGSASNYLPLSGGTITGNLNVNGSLGLGTTNPLGKLHVYDSGVTTLISKQITKYGNPDEGTYGGYLLLAQAYTSGLVNASWVNGTFTLKRGSTYSGNRTDTYEVASDTAYAGEDLYVRVTSNGGPFFTRTVKVTYSGVVYHAIETSVGGGNPDDGVWFNGSYSNCNPIYVDATYVSSVVAFGSSTITQTSNTGTMMYVGGTNGYVGIGTNAPTSLLDIFSSAAAANVLYIRNGTETLALGNNNTAGGSFVFENSSSALRFGTSSTERARIDASGNVGIGTTSPNYPLQINGSNLMNVAVGLPPSGLTGSGGFAQIIMSNQGPGVGVIGANGNSDFRLYANSYYGTGGEVYVASTAAAKYMLGQGYHQWLVAPTGTAGASVPWIYGMYMNSSGYVGIGTGSPQTWLQVSGSNGANSPTGGTASGAGLYVTNTDSRYGLLIGTGYNGSSWIQNQRTDSTYQYNLNLQPVGGLVGIGTSSPGLNSGGNGLHIVGNSFTQARFSSLYASAGFEINPSGGHNWEIQGTNDPTFIIYDRTTSQYKLTVRGDTGNVAIGYNSPGDAGYGLYVAGSFGLNGTFYDNSNSAYYIKASATSNLTNLNLAGYLSFSGNTTWFSQNGSTYTGNNLISAHTLANCAKLYGDSTFAYGSNGINVYDNAGSGNVTITRVASSTLPSGKAAPSNSGYVLKINIAGNAQSPGYGGFTFYRGTRANQTLVCYFKALLPSGYNWNFASNPYGSDGNAYWASSNVGTGKWEDYVFVVRVGSTGTFSDTMYFYIGGSPAPSSGSPLVVYLASADVYDWDDVQNGTTIQSGSLTTASNLLAVGSVGAGTRSPSYTLDVQGQGRVNSTLLVGGGAYSNYNEGLRLVTAANNFAVISMGVSNGSMTGVGGYNILYNPSTNLTLRPSNGTDYNVFDQSGNYFNYASVRAPIFYDVNNTGFYAYPSQTSNFNNLAINPQGDGNSSGAGQIGLWGGAGATGGTSTTSAFGFKNASGTGWGEYGTTGGWNTYFHMDSPGRGWVFRQVTAGGTNFGGVSVASITNQGNIWFAGTIYDGSNSGYYVKPSSTTVLYNLYNNGYYYPSVASNSGGGNWVFGSLAWGGSVGGVNSVAGGQYVGGTGSQLYTLASGPGQVSFQVDGSLFAGDAALSYNYWGLNGSSNGCLGISGLASFGDSAVAQNSMRADIFYDVGNTSYYVRPRATSIMSYVYASSRFSAVYDSGLDGSVNASNWFRSNGATGWYNSTYSGGIWMQDGTWVRTYNGKGFYNDGGIGIYTNQVLLGTTNPSDQVNGSTWYGIGQTSNLTGATGQNAVQLGGYGGIRLRSNSTIMDIDMSSGVNGYGNSWVYMSTNLAVSNQARANIYYDVNNTVYYVQPRYASQMWSIQLNGDWNNSGTGHPEVFTIRGSYPSICQRSTINSQQYWLQHNDSGNNLLWYSGQGNVDGTSWDWSFRLWNNANGNYAEARNSIRTNIFYDVGNTSYFVQPSNNSVFYSSYWYQTLFMQGTQVSGAIAAYAYSTQNVNSAAANGVNFYSTNSLGAIFSFHRGGYYAVNMGLDSDNVIRIGGWSASANRWQLDMSGNMYAAGNITAYSSDERLKENITPIADALDKIDKISGVYFDWKDIVHDLGFNPGVVHDTGVIAQEVEQVVPEAVRPAPFDLGENSESISGQNYKTVQYEKLVPLLIQALKELKQEVEELRSKIIQE